MELIIFFSIIVLIIILIIVFKIRDKRLEDKVIRLSKRIDNLVLLNSKVTFNEITRHLDISKSYDNKSNYMRIHPGYLMSTYLRENMEKFSTYINKMNENRVKNNEYREKLNQILNEKSNLDFKTLKLSKGRFIKKEEKIIESLIKKPVIDCIFTVFMRYSSPKGHVNLSKEQIFSFDDLFAAYSSVSRTTLDTKTLNMLKTVERSEVSDSLRYNVFAKDDFRCVICGASTNEGTRLHVDHIIPISKGGKSIVSNLQTLCERCNIGKSNKVNIKLNNDDTGKVNSFHECVKCGCSMVIRDGKNGSFYGCSNFPLCKHTKPIN